MTNIGTLETVDLREAWPNEAQDFTHWLASTAGLDALGNILGVALELVGKEISAGTFNVDVVAKVVSEGLEDGDDEERLVIIENQLEITNHDHLGKLITYAAGQGADIAVWIAKSFREEHRQAIDWLNETSTEGAFFALEIQLLRIGDSLPAPQFKVISRPNEWTKAVRASQTKQPSNLKLDQLHFWEELVQYGNSQGDTTLVARKPRPQQWYEIAVGRKDFKISLTAITQPRQVGCEVFISGENAKVYFEKLLSSKSRIEGMLGYALEWQELQGRIGSRIAIRRKGSIDNEQERPELIKWLYEKASEFYRVFSPIIKGLD